MSQVLFVCTGNICRSPAAAVMLAAAVQDGDDITVSSAGLSAVVGAGVAPPVARLLDARGYDATDFTARSLEVGMIRSADVVLTMTREQRSAVARIEPQVVRRLFTLRELARLARDLDLTDYPDATVRGKRLLWLVEQAAMVRSAPRRRRADDIADPFGGSPLAYRRSVRDIEGSIQSLTRLLNA